MNNTSRITLASVLAAAALALTCTSALAVDAEAAALREQGRQDSEAMRIRMSAESKRLSATIVSDARASSVGLFGELRDQVRAEFGARVLEKAEKLMKDRLTGDDRTRILQDFSKQVGNAQ